MLLSVSSHLVQWYVDPFLASACNLITLTTRLKFTNWATPNAANHTSSVAARSTRKNKFRTCSDSARQLALHPVPANPLERLVPPVSCFLYSSVNSSSLVFWKH